MTENDDYKKDARQVIPQFANHEEEAAFWDTHDMSDYWSELEPVKLKVAENLAPNSPDEKTM